MRLSVKTKWNDFIGGFVSAFDFWGNAFSPPPRTRFKTKILTPEEMMAAAWLSVGQSLKSAMISFEQTPEYLEAIKRIAADKQENLNVPAEPTPV